MPKPILSYSHQLLLELPPLLNRIPDREAWELAELLGRPHVRALVQSHDDIACSYGANRERQGIGKMREKQQQIAVEKPESVEMTNMMRMVGVRKKAGEPLGLTVSWLFSFEGVCLDLLRYLTVC